MPAEKRKRQRLIPALPFIQKIPKLYQGNLCVIRRVYLDYILRIGQRTSAKYLSSTCL